jgi:hypothetical protein
VRHNTAVIPTKLIDFDEKALKQFIDERAIEGLQLEFKRELNPHSDDGRSELLENVVSIANAAGGHLLIGVAEALSTDGKRLGYAGEAAGIQVPNKDNFKLAIKNALRDSIEPRLPRIDVHFVPAREGNQVVVIRLPKSNVLHLIRKRTWYKCLSRNSAGKFQLDVAQIRDAFLSGEQLPQRMRFFRAERLAKIAADETPLPIVDDPRIVIHLLPEASFASTPPSLDIRPATHHYIQGPFTSLANRIFNLDGFMAWTGEPGGRSIAYLQAFRTGAFEGVETGVGGASAGDKRINPAVDGYIINGLHRYLQVASALGTEPLYVAIALVGAKGFT